jgi:hypothetical protein
MTEFLYVYGYESFPSIFEISFRDKLETAYKVVSGAWGVFTDFTKQRMLNGTYAYTPLETTYLSDDRVVSILPARLCMRALDSSASVEIESEGRFTVIRGDFTAAKNVKKLRLINIVPDNVELPKSLNCLELIFSQLESDYEMTSADHETLAHFLELWAQPRTIPRLKRLMAPIDVLRRIPLLHFPPTVTMTVYNDFDEFRIPTAHMDGVGLHALEIHMARRGRTHVSYALEAGNCPPSATGYTPTLKLLSFADVDRNTVSEAVSLGLEGVCFLRDRSSREARECIDLLLAGHSQKKVLTNLRVLMLKSVVFEGRHVYAPNVHTLLLDMVDEIGPDAVALLDMFPRLSDFITTEITSICDEFAREAGRRGVRLVVIDQEELDMYGFEILHEVTFDHPTFKKRLHKV